MPCVQGKYLLRDLVWSFPSIATFWPLTQLGRGNVLSQKLPAPWGSWRGLQETAGVLTRQKHQMVLTPSIHHRPCSHSGLMAQSIFENKGVEMNCSFFYQNFKLCLMLREVKFQRKSKQFYLSVTMRKNRIPLEVWYLPMANLYFWLFKLPTPKCSVWGIKSMSWTLEIWWFHPLMDSSLINVELLIDKINAHYITSIAKS